MTDAMINETQRIYIDEAKCGNYEARLNDLEEEMRAVRSNEIETQKVLHSIDKSLAMLTSQMKGLLWLLAGAGAMFFTYAGNKLLEIIWP